MAYILSSLHNFNCFASSSAFNRIWARLTLQFFSSLFNVATIVASSAVERPSLSSSSVSCCEQVIKCCTSSAVLFLSLASFNFSLKWSISLRRDLKAFTYKIDSFSSNCFFLDYSTGLKPDHCVYWR